MRQPSLIPWLVLAVACGGDDSPVSSLSGGTEAAMTTGADSSASASSSGEASDAGATADDSSSGSADTPDPDYPRPDPVAEEGTCPQGYFGPITFDGGGWSCLPACVGDPAMCPEAATGDADAQCATNPMSSAAPCSDSDDCRVAGELCGNIGGGDSGCLLPPSHCILRCDEGQTCPDGQTCGVGIGICQYEG